MIGCFPCITQFDQVIADDPNFIKTLFDDPKPVWYDASVQKVLIAYYRKRIIGVCDVDEFKQLMRDKALIQRDRFNRLWDAYQIDLLDFSTSKARTSTVLETENQPDTKTAWWLKNTPAERPYQDVDSKLSVIDPISADRYLATRQASIVDYAGSSGLSTKTNLDDVNHFRDQLSGFIMDFVRIFETHFVGRY